MWDGDGDPAKPKNWPRRKKWAATFTVSLFTFVTPVSSSMITPALQQLKTDLRVSSELRVQLALSTFVLAFALGPLLLGPLSALHGRRPVLLAGNAFYFFFNLACGFATSFDQVIAFRFLSGLGGSAPLGIGVGVLPYGWGAQRGLHWVVPNAGTLLFAAGNQLVFQCAQTYVVDADAPFAASATAATAVLRRLGEGGGMPLFAPAMYERLGYGWGDSVLALAGVVVWAPAPVVLRFYGQS